MRTTAILLAAAAAIMTQQPLPAGAQNQPFDPGPAPKVELPRTLGFALSARPPVAPPETANVQPDGTASSSTSAPPAADNKPSSAKPRPAAAKASPPAPQKAAATPERTARSSPYPPGMVLNGTAHVYDGHSLAVAQHPVRLDGIEAPGRLQLCRTASGTAWKCGERATMRLKQLAEGAQMTCIVSGPAGHGAAAVCSVRGVPDLGLKLVQEGLAVPNRHGFSRYSASARSASAAKAGVWGGSFTDPAIWRRSNK